MTSYVLTLIGSTGPAPLEALHIELVCERLASYRGRGSSASCVGSAAIIMGEVNWLASDEACDLFMESSLPAIEIADQARDALDGSAIDVVCTSVNGRRKKLLISDMDSTVINQECIDELGDAFGVGGQIREITAAVVKGDIGFSDALRQRLALMSGMELALLESVYEDRISLKAGARTLVQTMRHHGAFCILVSGGFSFFTKRIAERIGFHDHQANELAFKEGKLIGVACEPILGRTAKLKTLTSLCDEKGLEFSDVLAVGDGANDIKMIKAAGLGVAFHGSHSLKENASACIDRGDLTALLYIQGFRKSEFVFS